MKNIKRGIVLQWYGLLMLILCLSLATQVQAQPYNRFQYHRYERKVLHTPAFHIYFPAGYDSLASFASVQLPDIIAAVKQRMGTYVRSVPNLVICPSPDQLYESNIGLYDNEVQTFPTINLKGSRVLVAFNGSYEQFREQLQEAWVRLTWEEQFRQDAEEQLTNKRQLMPDWYKKGCIRFFTSGWSADDETVLYTLFQGSPLLTWNELVQQEPVMAGQAFCYFLCQKYREDAAMQVLFQLRQGKSLSRSVRLVTKKNLDTLSSRCLVYYRERNNTAGPALTSQDTLRTFLQQRFKAHLVQLVFSQDNRQLCFVMEEVHRRLVYVTDIKTLQDAKARIRPFARYLLPPWLEQYATDRYPLAGWEKEGNGLYLVLPEKGRMVLKLYDAKGNCRDQYIFYGTDGITAVSQWDRSQWLLSAYRKGKSDIVLFDTRQLKYTALTNDLADHTEPVKNAGMLVYRSGYPADSLYHRDTAVKAYGIYTKEIREPFKQMAAAKDKPLALDSAWTSWRVSGQTGQGAVVLQHTRSGITQRDTVSLLQSGLVTTGAAVKPAPWLRDHLANLRRRDSIAALLDRVKANDTRSILAAVLSPGDSKAAAQLQQDSMRKALAYTSKKVRPYLLQLYSAYFSAQVNNDYYINRYQPYQAYLGTFKFPEAGAMAQGGFSDLFDNHHFNIGYRLPAGTEGSDFFVRYENTARKLDWHVLFFRKVESLKPDPERDWKDSRGNPYPQAAKVRTHYYELGFRYPLHYDWTLEFTTAARRDRTIFLATDPYSLTYEALQSWWSISSLSLRVNKLKPTIPFLYKGWEGRALLDLMASTGKQSTIVYGTQLLLACHQPLWKDITFVIQAQAGYSGGQSRILYNFGGLDNNIVPRTDTSVRFAQDAPYAFQSLITPLRGYVQNSLYGSSFGLLNMDLYFPLFRSLIPLHTGFAALNNLQLGLFTDIAAAATPAGLPAMPSPRYAYGASARTMLAGYPLRFDIAWPGSFQQQPVWYLSLTLK